MGFFQDLFGGKSRGATVNVPQFQLPDYAEQVPQELLGLIRQGVGAQVPMPQEYGIASQALQNILGLQPQQFQFPMDAIQQALAAQQALQLQDYQKQIRPMLAQQGQLDSSYYTNLISDFLRNQQAQTYGTTADLLTQQALQNLQLQQYFPQLQSGVAGQLTGLGSNIAGLNLQNIQLPYQTSIPAMQGFLTNVAMPIAGKNLEQANLASQVELNKRQQDLAAKTAANQGIGNFALSTLMGGLGGLSAFGGAGGLSGFAQGALQGAQGISPFQSQLLGSMGTQQQSSYTPQYSNAQINQLMQPIQAPNLRFNWQYQ